MNCEADSRTSSLVIGYGSPLRGDDRAGPVAAEQLAALGYRARAVAQLTPELAAEISGFRRVIFLDASAGIEPGEVAVRPLQPEDRMAGPFEHHSTPSGLLQLAADCYGWHGQAFLIAIGCREFGLSEECSEAARRAIAGAIRAVQQLPATSGG